jgi:hypothetical protein
MTSIWNAKSMKKQIYKTTNSQNSKLLNIEFIKWQVEEMT